MHFKQFYLGCLAQASYLIGSDGEAAVVDPRRDVDEYLAEAEAHGLRIRWVIETHLHADFVSGHRELAERTGAQIVFGRQAGVRLPHRAVCDGEELAVGRVRLRFLETPGHTPESICVLVFDDSPEPVAVLTGDTLFVGDVGRPDLVGARGRSAEEMAGLLYDSLHRKLLTLPDAVAVYPAHGAGSLCGRNMSNETWSTIGQQRRVNHALRPMSREDFVRLATADLPEVPQYFAGDVAINLEGAAPLAGRELPPALDPAGLKARTAQGALVLDARSAAAFGAGHVPGSVNVGLGGQFASWAGTLIPAATALVIVAEGEAGAHEAVTRLARVGLEKVVGWLAGGLAAWEGAGEPLGRLPQLPVDELRARLGEPGAPQVLDVRRLGEFRSGHVPSARHLPLDQLEQQAGQLDASRPVAVVCAGGYRSSAACSLLLRQGFAQVSNVVGGTSAWVAAGLPLEMPGPAA